MKKLANYINGKLVPPLNNNYIDNYSPTNGKVYSLTPDGAEEDVEVAIEAAKVAFASWGKSKKEYRYKWMMKLADAIDEAAVELIVAESFDNGKP